jgi:hypothetical protein
MQGLSHFIKQIPDHRRRQGTRHPFHPFITMIILANLGGYHGLNEMTRFIEHNAEYFKKIFNLRVVPGYTILRTFCAEVSFDAINQAFCNWASQHVEAKEWFSIDGKGLNSTVSDPSTANQNFKSIVSMFGHKSGIVLRSNSYENKTSSEIYCVQELIRQLDQKGLVLTLDALHCQKKLLKLSWLEEMTM